MIEVIDKKRFLECTKDAIEEFKKQDDVDVERLKSQIVVVNDIIDGVIDGTRNFIVDAPTGFGKSFLAFMLTNAIEKSLEDGCITYRIDNKEEEDLEGEGEEYIKGISYINTSNKFLQDQYERDIKRFKFKTYASLKGMSNYKCLLNNENCSKRVCKKTPASRLATHPKFADCSQICEYVAARNAAINASCTVFNYSYFLTTMNMVYDKIGSFAPFVPRPITILDECHVLQGIAQDSFCFNLDLEDVCGAKLYVTFTSARALYGQSLIEGIIISDADVNEVKKMLVECKRYYSDLMAIAGKKDNDINDKQIGLDLCDSIIKKLSFVLIKFSKVTNLESFTKDPDKQNKNEKDICDALEKVGVCMYNIKKMFWYDVNDLVFDINDKVLCIKNVNESEIIKETILTYTDIAIFMSATVGGIDSYAKTHGITDYKGIEVDSDFTFKDCEIYEITPVLKMTYKDRDANMGMMLERIEKIMNLHPNEKGIIHTGTFAFMKDLEEYFKYRTEGKRLLFCKNAEEKLTYVDLLRTSKDPYIICGPSLVEGVDLKDDMARFCIFMKVPYPFMGDKLVREKMERFKNWYNWATMCNLLQGIGRPVRHKNDWAKIYLVDGSFGGFFGRLGYKKLPKILRSRLCNMYLGDENEDDGLENLLDNIGNADFDFNNIAENIKQPESTIKPIDEFGMESMKFDDLFGDDLPF